MERGWCAGKAQGDGMGRLGGRRVQDGEHVIFFKKIKLKKKKKKKEKKNKKKIKVKKRTETRTLFYLLVKG